MNTYAQVKDNKVLSIIMWDGVSEISIDGELVIANADTYIGGAYEDGKFTPLVSPQEKERLEAEAIAKEEAREAIRASALQKLVENAGLTVEEVEEFLKVEL